MHEAFRHRLLPDYDSEEPFEMNRRKREFGVSAKKDLVLPFSPPSNQAAATPSTKGLCFGMDPIALD